MNKLLLPIIALLAACGDRSPPPPEPQNVRPAKLLTVQRQGGDLLRQFTARIEALQSIDVSFEVGGPLTELAVREGETIAAGSVIAALDPVEFELAVAEAEVELKLAAQDLDRKKRVLAEQGIAKSVVEDAQSHYELQQVRLRKEKEKLADTKIHAPFEAYVSRRHVDNHVNVQPGQPIVKLHDLNRLLVVISVPESLTATVSEDRLITAWVEFAFAPGEKFPIAYHENRGEADSLAQTYEVSFTMENPQHLNILPGMTAAVKAQIRGTDAAAILIPASALVPAPDGSLSVWVFDDATRQVSRRPVETGAPTQAGVPVINGLESGDRIVMLGASQLQAGMQIRPLDD